MDPILGEIRVLAGKTVPNGWHLCDGSTLSISTYQALYSLLGTIYGGDGATTFGIPDLRGRGVVNQGKSAAPANTSYTIGQKGGSEVVTIQTANIVPHTHTFTVSAQAATNSVPTNSFLAAPVDPTSANKTIEVYLPNTATGLTKAEMNTSAVTYSQESGQAHENRQPFIIFNYMICLQGVYPEFP
jgi:microcystin-dependent protein